MRQALKKCAPLSRNSWHVYTHRKGENFYYGVFRTPAMPTAVGIRDTLISLYQSGQKLKMILASQLSEKSVELVGTNSGCLHLYLSATPADDLPSPQEALDKLVDMSCQQVPEEIREQVASFLRKTLTEGLRYCHGTLISVLPENGVDIDIDGVWLDPPIDIPQLVKEYRQQQNDEKLAQLNAYSSLLSNMLTSDGIVLLDQACRIRGYNVFVKTEAPETALMGGARRRAFHSLCCIVDDKKLKGCFIRSSDGNSEFYGGV